MAVFSIFCNVQKTISIIKELKKYAIDYDLDFVGYDLFYIRDPEYPYTNSISEICFRYDICDGVDSFLDSEIGNRICTKYQIPKKPGRLQGIYKRPDNYILKTYKERQAWSKRKETINNANGLFSRSVEIRTKT